MALAFLVLFYTFPAGMVLYWTTNNLISVIKALWKKYKLSDS
jgi:membrane protein insertase Oxa1/YidC/SpoIIIJ